MEKKKFWLGILAVALVFGMTIVGCGDDSNDDDDYDLPELVGIVSIVNNNYNSISSTVIGDTLTATFEAGYYSDTSGGTVSGAGRGTAKWEWIRGASTVINGANSNSYTVVAADVGYTLKVRLSYSESRGSKESVQTTNPVIGIPSTANVSVSIETIKYSTSYDVSVYLTLSD
jgi:hypothetical protein